MKKLPGVGSPTTGLSKLKLRANYAAQRFSKTTLSLSREALPLSPFPTAAHSSSKSLENPICSEASAPGKGHKRTQKNSRTARAGERCQKAPTARGVGCNLLSALDDNGILAGVLQQRTTM